MRSGQWLSRSRQSATQAEGWLAADQRSGGMDRDSVHAQERDRLGVAPADTGGGSDMTCWRLALEVSPAGAALLRRSAGVLWGWGVKYKEKLRRPGGGASAEDAMGLNKIGSIQSFGECGNQSSQRLDLFVCSQGMSAEGEERLQFE
jgi:hypothetical protein